MKTPESHSRPLTVLIAGCGYLGQEAALRWTDAGIPVFVITRSQEKAKSFERLRIRPIIGDLASGCLPRLPDIDTVLWSVGYERSEGVSRDTVWINGLSCLLADLPLTVRRFIYVSSTSVYGQSGGETVTEDTLPDPATESGRCCLKAEHLVREFGSSRQPMFRTIVLRMAGLYGPHRLLRRISELKSGIPLPDSPGQLLNLIHRTDAATAVLWMAAIQNPPTSLNVVNTGTLTRGDYYRELARLSGAPEPKFENRAPRERRGRNKRVVSVIRDRLGIPFAWDDVRAGLRDAVSQTQPD